MHLKKVLKKYGPYHIMKYINQDDIKYVNVCVF